ncbi:fasciclin-3-like isoform X2 [Toxorhynchites rutilus septentrionalis]|nr:fasciclin-3-like isoform X2 [Toxorhynchites rutilus septentrionalis]
MMDCRLRPFGLSSAAAVWIAVVLCVARSSLVQSQSQPIETIPSKAYVRSLTKNVNLLCRSSKPVEACSVKIAGYMGTYDIRELPEGVSYYGSSLPHGECGITIATLKAANEGKFQCNLTIGGEVFQESIEVVIAVTPEPTEIEIGRETILSLGGIAPNQTISAKCISQDAVPQANLSWYLNDDPLDSSLLGPIETRVTVDKKGKKLTTVEQKLRYFVTPEDNGKRIICRADHFAISRGFYRAFLPLNILFPPKPIPNIYIGEGTHAVINVTVRANPRPTTSWKVNGIRIDEGTSSGPYQAYIPKDMDNGNYLILLKINEPTEQTSIIELAATNELGTQTYVIKASKYPAEEETATANDENETKSTGSGTVFWLISIWTFFCSVIVT